VRLLAPLTRSVTRGAYKTSISRSFNDTCTKVYAGSPSVKIGPDEHHRRAWCGSQDDRAGDVLIRELWADQRQKQVLEKYPTDQRHRKGFHEPVYEQVISTPRTRLRTPRTLLRSTFSIIG
jgi:hypothetical protein